MKKIISKLLIGTITEKELIELRNWLNDSEKRSILESYVRDQHDLNLTTIKNNVDTAYQKVIGHIDRNERPVKRLIPNWTRYAAAFVLLFGIGFLLHQVFFLQENETSIISKEEFITLELDNGEVQTIDVSQTKQVTDADGNIIGTQNRNQISYSQTIDKNELIFNTLRIPNGKQFELELSDGTQVRLNAGSSLRYPVNFSNKGYRQVFLAGEAYFDVAENKSMPFIVNVDELDVKVLGTEFNITAYDEDTNIDVVLVEGLVSLDSRDSLLDKTPVLTPGQKGSFDFVTKDIKVAQVNTEMYTLWMKGHLVFRYLTFDQIVRKLERHYNVEIVNNNSELGNEIFNASFDKVEIGEVFSFFSDTHEIEYSINENKIFIK